MRYCAAAFLILVYGLFCWWCWRKYQRQQLQRNLQQKQGSAAFGAGSADILIAYASQTGQAITIAQQTAQQLTAAQKNIHLVSLNQLSAELLQQNSTLLIIASTYGEGEAPDNANRFIARTLANLQQNSLQHLQVALLGLGDSSYKHYCGFAHQLQHELQHCGAHFITDVIEVDKLEASALRHWQYYLGQISGQSHYADWSKPEYSHWNIVQRECINPGSPGAPAFHLKLVPLDGAIVSDAWRAGDIAEIGPGNSEQTIRQFLQQLGRDAVIADEIVTTQKLLHSDLMIDDAHLAELKNLADEELVGSLKDLPHREYSIASVPNENSLDLLVRQVKIASDHYGLGSGWLSLHAQLQQPIRLRVRANAHFHSPANNCPLILIGNGTGIAGLRSHLASRACQMPDLQTRNWLLFGERTKAADNFFAEDIQQWQTSGVLTRVERVFSRDALPGEPRYVQDLLPRHAAELERWVQEGAAIFVCGSLQGMAQAVDDALRTILGAGQLELMADQRRYCRDVY